MVAVRFVLLLVAVLAYAATSVGLLVRATDHEHASPDAIERTGPTRPHAVPKRNGAEEYSPGPASLTKQELADLRSFVRRDQPSRRGK